MRAQAILSSDHPHSSKTVIYNLIQKDDVDSLESLFIADPDSLFANPEFEFNLAAYAAVINPNSRAAKLLNRLGKQYESDIKTAKDWEKLYYYFLSHAQYSFHIKNFQLAGVIFSYAVHYAEKLINEGKKLPASKYANTQDLYLKISQCGANHLVTLKQETSLPKQAEKKLTLKRTIRSLIKTIGLASYPHDEATQQLAKSLRLFQVEHSRLESAVATIYNDEADQLFLQLLSQPERIDTTSLNRVVSLYETVKLHLQLAYKIMSPLVMSDQHKEESDLIAGIEHDIEQTNQKIANLPSFSSMPIPPTLTLNELSELVGDCDTPITDIEDYLREHKINIDEQTGIYQISGTNGQISSVQASPLHNAVASGSLQTVKYLVDVENASLPLFSTLKTLGLYHALSLDTHPDVSEYMMEPPEKFLQGDPNREMHEFLIHTMAGRLDKVQAYLKRDPDAIFKNPVSRINQEACDEFTVLYYALHGAQAHVVHWLENFITEYAILNLKAGFGIKLKFLFKTIIESYNKFGWTSDRHMMVDDLAIEICELFQKQVDEFNQLPESEKQKQPDACYQNQLNKLNGLEILFWIGLKNEAQGMTGLPQHMGQAFYMAKATFKRCMEIADLDQQLLVDVPQLTQLVDAVLQANIHIDQAISKLADLTTPVTFHYIDNEEEEDKDEFDSTMALYNISERGSETGEADDVNEADDEISEDNKAELRMEEDVAEENKNPLTRKRKSPSITAQNPSSFNSSSNLFATFKIEDATHLEAKTSPEPDKDEDEKARTKLPRQG